MLSIYYFSIAAIICSFALWLAQQLIQGKIHWLARSQCPHCQHPLAWHDLIPILSQLLLKSRCRYCNAPFAHYYWVGELIPGCLSLCWYWHTRGTLPMLTQCFDYLLLLILTTMAWCDYFTYTVPDRLQLSLLPICLYLTFTQPNWQEQLLMSLGVLLLLILLYLLRPNWMGGADLKLLALLLPTLPWPLHPHFIGGSALFGLVYYSISKRWQQPIPFIPCIVLGYWMVAR